MEQIWKASTLVYAHWRTLTDLMDPIEHSEVRNSSHIEIIDRFRLISSLISVILANIIQKI